MSQTSLSVWFVCRLCRGSFGQVDAFIEHKKQKHFTQFQNTTSIVFEESEHGELCPVIIKAENQLTQEHQEPPIKIEVTDGNPIIPFSSEINDEPNLVTFELKNETVTYESDINPENEINFFGLEQPQPEQNPDEVLKGVTSDEIQTASVPQSHSALLKYEEENLTNILESPNSMYTDNLNDHRETENSAQIPPTAIGQLFPRESDPLLECKLCSTKFESDAQLKIHVGICALYHKDRNRFCVICNRKFYNTKALKYHRLRFHGTEEEKLSLYKFKCHVCPKRFQQASDLICHLETHKRNKKNVETSKSKPFKCLHPNCGKEFRFNSELQRHIAAVHLGVKPFGCPFPNCNNTFALTKNLTRHFMIHTGERPFKCTVDNCNKAFRTSDKRLSHHRTVHRCLLNE